MNHSYKNDEDWLVDYEKYVGIIGVTRRNLHKKFIIWL